MATQRLLNRTSFGAGVISVLYYAIALPLAGYAIVILANVSKSDRWYGFLGGLGILVVIAGFVAGRSWVRVSEQWVAQRSRDRRAALIREAVGSGRGAGPYSLYLRPFTSTGRIRIPLRSAVRKRGVIAGPGMVFDPELGRTSRYKRYVRFGDFETLLAECVETRAPLVALGRQAEQIGAGRVAVEDRAWQAEFERLAAHAAAIFLVPSRHSGTRSEIQAILHDPDLLRKTVFFVPPYDTVLGSGAGPHLDIGARPGPVGVVDIRQDAIAAAAEFARPAQVERLEQDTLGAFFRVRTSGRIAGYRALTWQRSVSLALGTVGANLRIDRDAFGRIVNDAIQADGSDQGEQT